MSITVECRLKCALKGPSFEGCLSHEIHKTEPSSDQLSADYLWHGGTGFRKVIGGAMSITVECRLKCALKGPLFEGS